MLHILPYILLLQGSAASKAQGAHPTRTAAPRLLAARATKAVPALTAAEVAKWGVAQHVTPDPTPWATFDGRHTIVPGKGFVRLYFVDVVASNAPLIAMTGDPDHPTPTLDAKLQGLTVGKPYVASFSLSVRARTTLRFRSGGGNVDVTYEAGAHNPTFVFRPKSSDDGFEFQVLPIPSPADSATIYMSKLDVYGTH